MVTYSNNHIYPIAEVLEAAAAQRVTYVGRKVQRDISNLDYSFEDVCECLGQVPQGIFLKTQDCTLQNGKIIPGDSYNVDYQSAFQDCSDQIYLKFFMKNDQLFLCSFHLSS